MYSCPISAPPPPPWLLDPGLGLGLVEAFVSRSIVHLFVSKMGWPQAQQYLVPLYM